MIRNILIFLIAAAIGYFGITYYLDSKKDYTKINPNYKKEVVKKCPSFEEAKQNPALEKMGCTSDANLFSPQEFDAALDFAKQIKYLYRTKDLKTLANIVKYPVHIRGYKKDTEMRVVNSKQMLMVLDKNTILNPKTFKAISNSPLFWNWQGFMLGDGDIWFYCKDGEISDLTINLD